MSKWVKKLQDKGEAEAIIQERLERRRMMNRLWAQNNKHKKAANKKAYKARKRLEATAKLSNPTGTVIKSTYRPNWKEAPVYSCPELTYRGKTT
jgi:hypothetical protein